MNCRCFVQPVAPPRYDARETPEFKFWRRAPTSVQVALLLEAYALPNGQRLAPASINDDCQLVFAPLDMLCFMVGLTPRAQQTLNWAHANYHPMEAANADL